MPLAKRTFLPAVLPVVIIAIVVVRLTLGRWTHEANLASGAIALVGVAVAWFTVRVRPAEADLPDRRPMPSDFETREGPPPFDPRFRGSSGPPPRQKD